MQAVVTRINVAEGQYVAKGDLLVVLESMKMENYVYAPVNGDGHEDLRRPAAGVEAGETLVTMDVDGAKARDSRRGDDGGKSGSTAKTARRASDDRYHEIAGREEAVKLAWHGSAAGAAPGCRARQPIRASVVRPRNSRATPKTTPATASTPKAR